MLLQLSLLKATLIWLLLVLSVSTRSEPLEGVVVDKAYVRAVIPGQNNTSAYFRLRNFSGLVRSILDVSSELAKNTAIHEHRHHNGMMQMREVSSLVLNVGQEIEFAPGGLHLMLMDVVRPLPQEIPLIFSFSNGEILEVKAQLQ